jgi:hypothetical protein
MSDVPVMTPAEWRNFGTRFPITACRITREDLKRLYKLINERQAEYREKIVAIQSQQSQETPEAFAARRRRVYNAHVTSVTIEAKNGERLTGNNEQIFDAVTYWADVKSVFFSTQSVPQAVIGVVPQDRVALFLDFTQPPALDFSKLPTLPTQNESNFEIAAVDEAWFILTKTRLVEFFEQRRSGYNWIHDAGVYDILLMVFGLPLGVWGTVKVESIIPAIDYVGAFPRVLIYCYSFLASLTMFRVMFSYARWVFPKVEIETQGRMNPLRHRAVWAVILGALVLPAFYDAVKACVGYLVSR